MIMANFSTGEGHLTKEEALQFGVSPEQYAQPNDTTSVAQRSEKIWAKLGH